MNKNLGIKGVCETNFCSTRHTPSSIQPIIGKNGREKKKKNAIPSRLRLEVIKKAKEKN